MLGFSEAANYAEFFIRRQQMFRYFLVAFGIFCIVIPVPKQKMVRYQEDWKNVVDFMAFQH